MNKTRAPLLVGILLLSATSILGYFVASTNKDKYGGDQTFPIHADFTDAAGLRANTRVQIAGIDVGRIEGVSHHIASDGTLVARVRLRILKDFTLYENAQVRKVPESLLGDFRIDIVPGQPGPGIEILPPEGVITQVQSTSDLEAIQSELRKVSESLGNVLGGPEGQQRLDDIMNRVQASLAAIQVASESLARTMQKNDAVVDSILRNVDSFTGALANQTGSGGDVNNMLSNLSSMSGRLDRIAAEVEGLMGATAEGEEGKGDPELRQAVGNLNDSVKSLSSIMRKIDEGQGTVGKLINDPGVHDEAQEALENVGELVGGFTRLQTEVEFRSEVVVPFEESTQVQTSVKNTLGLRLKPKPDKYYLVELVADPRGRNSRNITTTTDSSGNVETVEESRIRFGGLKFTAMFAKRYYWLTLRFGIIESSGGIGANMNFIKDRLEFQLDMFDFDRRNPNNNASINPRMRFRSMFEFVNHLSIQAGLDDPFTGLRTVFFGGVLRFTDEDLRTLFIAGPPVPN